MIPPPNLNNIFPYVLLNHTTLDYSHLRVFHCLTYATTIPILGHKFSSPADFCVFVGYSSGVKG